MINGIILINKEKKFTSHDVVAKMRGIAEQKKVGHTGTLDPEATGVLPLCFGKATKVCDLLTNKTKEYKATLLLGKESDTQDIWGTILKESPINVSEDEIKEAVLSYIGESLQIPPMYSALKVNGKKLYELAREGKEIDREPRKIVISMIEIDSVQIPEVTFRVVCSKGTYIRTLCYDIGKKLGCGGLMSSLTRTRVGDFLLEQTYTLDQVQERKDRGELGLIVLPVDTVFLKLKKIHIKKDAKKWIDNGNVILSDQTEEYDGKKNGSELENGEEIRVYNDDKEFCAIYTVDVERNLFVPKKMFI